MKAHLLAGVLEPFTLLNVVNLFWSNERMSEMFEKCRTSTLPRPRPRAQGCGYRWEHLIALAEDHPYRRILVHPDGATTVERDWSPYSRPRLQPKEKEAKD